MIEHVYYYGNFHMYMYNLIHAFFCVFHGSKSVLCRITKHTTLSSLSNFKYIILSLSFSFIHLKRNSVFISLFFCCLADNNIDTKASTKSNLLKQIISPVKLIVSLGMLLNFIILFLSSYIQ